MSKALLAGEQLFPRGKNKKKASYEHPYTRYSLPAKAANESVNHEWDCLVKANAASNQPCTDSWTLVRQCEVDIVKTTTIEKSRHTCAPFSNWMSFWIKNLKTKLGSLLNKNHNQVELKEREQMKEIQKFLKKCLKFEFKNKKKRKVGE